MFVYKNNILFIEDTPFSEIIKRTGTPCYIYSQSLINSQYTILRDLFSGLNCSLRFSVKSLGNIAILALLKKLGAGADIVSGGELFRCKKAGMKGRDLVFSGAGKTAEEIKAALDFGVEIINAESTEEIGVIEQIAAGLGRTARIAFRINPDVDARTHKKITTGKKETKFGIAPEQAAEVLKNKNLFPHIDFCGVDMHIGSQILSAEPFTEAVKKMFSIIDSLAAYNFKPQTFNLGGGFGIVYNSKTEKPFPFTVYRKKIIPLLQSRPYRYLIEPGRFISGPSGLMIAGVQYTKNTAGKNFIITDAGFNDLVRPAMYESYHEISPCIIKTAQKPITADIVGPLCETGDIFAAGRSIEPVKRGEYLAFFNAGAYGTAMSSMYNSRPLAPEGLVSGSSFRIIRKRWSYKDMLR